MAFMDIGAQGILKDFEKCCGVGSHPDRKTTENKDRLSVFISGNEQLLPGI
jgi:hypothetical protein